MEKGSPEGSPFSKLAELFTSPRKTRNEKPLPSKFLHCIGKSLPESSTGRLDRDCQPYSQWVLETKVDIAASSSFEDVKPFLFSILDRVHNLECNVERERQTLSKELDMIKKHKPFRSSSSGFWSKNSSAETSPTKQRNEPPFIYTGQRRRSSSEIQRYEHPCVYTGQRRRSSSETIIHPKVSPIIKESILVKPRRKSSGFWSKCSSAETSPTKQRYEQPCVYTGQRRRSSSEIIIRPKVSPIIEESVLVKPRRKSSAGLAKYTVKSERMGLFRRSSSTPVIEKGTSSCPAIADIQTWTESFDALLRSERGRTFFQKFLRSEYSEENILFWTACEKLHEEQHYTTVEKEARRIFNDFIACWAPREVSLDSHIKEVILRNMKEPNRFTFDKAQEHIYHLMRTDSFPRFINSDMFRNQFEKA